MLFARSKDGVIQIRLRPEARLDIYEASRFYDRQSDGLGDKFVESIFEDMERLSQFAGIHSKLGRYFRILSQKFPFMIYYYVNGEEIVVVAVLSCRMLPATINDTLDER
jgi:plasmid stabilization system protein ParE